MSKNKKPKMGNVVVRANPDELVTVRNMMTVQYLVACKTAVRISAAASGDSAAPFELSLYWSEREDASILPRSVAERVSAAYIGLTGDGAVELEPVVEEVL